MMEILNKLHHKKPPTDHLPTIFWPPTDHLPTIYRPSTNHLPTTYRPSTNHLPTTYRPPTNHLPTIYRPSTDHLPTTYWPSTDYHLPTTYRPLTDYLLTIYQPCIYRPPTDHLPTIYRLPTDHFFTVQLVQYFLQLFLGVNSCVHDVMHLSGQTGAEIVTVLFLFRVMETHWSRKPVLPIFHQCLRSFFNQSKKVRLQTNWQKVWSWLIIYTNVDLCKWKGLSCFYPWKLWARIAFVK